MDLKRLHCDKSTTGPDCTLGRKQIKISLFLQRAGDWARQPNSKYRTITEESVNIDTPRA